MTVQASNGPSLLEHAYSLTVDDLIKMMPEIERKFPKDKECPNPADVHPATFAALKNVCDKHVSAETLPFRFPDMTAIVLHVRTDVEPWKMHPCTCGAHK